MGGRGKLRVLNSLSVISFSPESNTLSSGFIHNDVVLRHF